MQETTIDLLLNNEHWLIYLFDKIYKNTLSKSIKFNDN